ncbi:MAG: T9SS type A sorting domain-containing protein [Flavobacteriales bacterium]|nr:T9SS type A sorting domain-containing protein [Flavobacteriales bacterium]MCB9446747.1 T9SS type A sorting domain-containing protein [Flavobacteriales bacterium]
MIKDLRIHRSALRSIQHFLTFIFFLVACQSSHAAQYYWVGGQGFWSAPSSTSWSNASGGAPGYGPPGVADTVIFDANSFAGAGDTVFVSGNVSVKMMEWNGVNFFPVLSLAAVDTLFVEGSFVLDPNMALDMFGTVVFNTPAGTHSVNTNGMLMNGNIVKAGTGTLQLDSPLETIGDFILSEGTLNTNTFLFRCHTFDGDGGQSLTRALNLTSSTVTIEGDWSIGNATGLSFNAGTSQMMLNNSTSASFTGAGLSYNVVNFHSGAAVILGANTFNTLNIDTGTIGFAASIIQSFNDMSVSSSGNVTLQSGSSGTQATLNSLSGTPICWDNLSMQDINVTGAPCHASNTTDNGNNAGVTFAACPSPLSVTISDTLHVTCTGAADGRAVALPQNGYPPYTFHWDDPSLQTTDTAFNLAGGSYNVLVVDNTNDSAYATVTINEPATLAFAPSITPPACFGGCDGNASINANGGTAPYTYQWGINGGYATTNLISSLCANNYLFTVTDANGCVFSDTIFVANPGAIAVSPGSLDPLCNGGCDGSAWINPSNGVPPYTFAWGDGQTTDTASALCAGMHYITVTDNNGCLHQDSVSVNEPSPLSTAMGNKGTQCNGGCDGKGWVTPAGGVGPYAFQWDSNAGNQTTDTALSLCTGTYRVTVTDANGCFKEDSVMIGEPTALSLVVGGFDTKCNGSCDGKTYVNASGGVGPYSYQWDINTGYQTTDTAFSLCALSYGVTVTDNNGCTAMDVADVYDPTILNGAINALDAHCAGSCDGKSWMVPAGGVPPYMFQWDSNAGNQTTDTAFGLCVGSYHVTVTDNNGCFFEDSITINEPPLLTASVTSGDVLCAGACDGSGTVSGSGGQAPYSYQWDGAAGNQTTSTAVNLCAGFYKVTTTDNAGCMRVDSVTVNEPTPLYSITNQLGAKCAGSCDGKGWVTPTGGVPPFSYQWDSNASNQTTDTAFGLCVGWYYVTVTDNNSCFHVDSIMVNEPVALTTSTNQMGTMCSGSCDGKGWVTPNGGIGPYAFQWDSNASNQTTDTAFGLCAGMYHVTVTDNNGCFHEDSVAVNEPVLLTTSTNQMGTMCSGSCDGKGWVTPNGGVGPYAFQWDSNASSQTSDTAFGLCAGMYHVTVTDNNGCFHDDSVAVGEPILLTTSTNQQGTKCSGSCDGKGWVTPNGGVGPYAFQWDSNAGSQTSDTAFGLCAGMYHVTVTDNNGCYTEDSVMINEPPALGTTTNQMDAMCSGSCDGKGWVTPNGGVPPYMFQWDSNAGNQTSDTALGLCVGSYVVTVTDNNGCFLVDSVNINEPSPLYSSTFQKDVMCAGVCDGKGWVTPSGGNAPYVFQWDSNAGSQTGDTAFGLCTGMYYVTVTDNNGCFHKDSVTISEPIAMSTTTNQWDVMCAGSCDGKGWITATGGVPPYAFMWDGGAGNQTTDTAFGLCMGKYFVTVTDYNGCFHVDSVTINEPTPLFSNTNQQGAMCAGSCDGKGWITATGGAAPYMFQWDSNAGSQTSDTAFGLCVGMYHVTVTDNNGCSHADSVAINEPTPLYSTTNQLGAMCAGSCDGKGWITATGGNAPYMFQWDSNAGSQTSDTAVGLCMGTYYVTVTDKNGCYHVDSVAINEPSPLSAGVTSTDPNCSGACDGTATMTASGGVGPYNYTWDAGAGNQTTATANNLCAGTYMCTITDNNGCMMVDSVVINDAAPMTSTMAQTDVNCSGTCDGSATVTPAGGQAPYTYAWDAGAGNQTTATANSLCVGTYFVNIMDSKGCSHMDSVTINEPSPMSAAMGQQDVNCSGSCDGKAWVSAAGGVGPYVYQWDSNAGNQTTDTAFNLCAGMYYVTVYDANQCFLTDSVAVNQPTPVSISMNNTDVMCQGVCDGSATVNVTGGVGPYTFQWDANAAGQTTQTANNLCAGWYLVTVYDNGGCYVVDSVNIAEPVTMTTSVNTTGSNCSGGCDGSATVNATGGVPPYTYLWDAANQTTATANNLCDGLYHVSVTDANGCMHVDSAMISGPAPITITFNTSGAICAGTCEGSAQATASGGNAPYTFQWDDPGASTASDAQNLCPGTYHVIVTDATGCSATDSVTIYQFTPIVLTSSATNATCGNNNGSGTVNVSGGVSPYNIQWPSTAGSQTSATANNLGKGSYMVMVSDANGCTDSVVVLVSETGGPSVSLSKTDPLCNGSCDGTATATASGGTAPYSYQWDALAGSQTTATAVNLCDGLYYVTVSDGGGCSTIDTVRLIEPMPMNLSLTNAPSSCPSQCDATATVVANGGSAPYTYLWSDATAQKTATANNLCMDSYDVTVTDANGCMVSNTTNINTTGVDPGLTGQVNYSGGGASGLQVKLLQYHGVGKKMTHIDSTYTDGTGTYAFSTAPVGQFVVLAITDTFLYPNTMSTFHDSAFKWENATIFTMNCGDSAMKNVKLIEFPTPAGKATVKGTIVRGGSNKHGVLNVISGDPIPDVEVTLKSKPGNMVKGHTKTNGSGQYQFPNVEDGSYDLWVDIPGLPMDSTYAINVSADDTTFNQMDFMVDSNSIYIPDVTTYLPKVDASGDMLAVFPNPFKLQASIQYSLASDSHVKLQLMNMVGEEVMLLVDADQAKGDHQIDMRAADSVLKPGVYLVKMEANGHTTTLRMVMME